ncbi:MAG TPA: universal stress protein, partial [Bdellovibrionota bacterium]|nr:universal stress protein [Bdellovibrionota bacterium]
MACLHVPRKVIWAVDAFEGAANPPVRAAAQLAGRLIEAFQAKVEPVYVLNPAELNLSSEFSVPWVTRYRPYAERALTELMKRLGSEFGQFETPHVLVQDSASTARAIETLSDYATACDADLIVVSTHGRSGMKRLLLGSFAETLILKSRVPVAAIGPELASPIAEKPLSHILFPTDLGDDAKATFYDVVELARQTQAKITLFHAIPHPIEPIVSSGVYLLGGGWVPVESYFADETRLRERRAEAWVRWAKQRGVEAEVAIEYRGVSIAQRIVEVARDRRTSCIVMEG